LSLDRLARFPLSGPTPARSCAVEAVSPPSSSAWKRRLAAQATGATTAASKGGAGPGARLLPVRLPAAGSSLEVVLGNGVLLRIPPGSDLAWVRHVAQAPGVPPC
jgi:hypothetical protein